MDSVSSHMRDAIAGAIFTPGCSLRTVLYNYNATNTRVASSLK